MNKPECVHIVADSQGNWTHFRQCEKSGTVDVDGYLMCKVHAKKARTRGDAHVVDPDGKGRYGSAPTKHVKVEKDEVLVNADTTRWNQQERNRHENDPYFVGAKWRAISGYAVKRLAESGQDVSEFEQLSAAHPDDVERLTAELWDRVSKEG